MTITMAERSTDRTLCLVSGYHTSNFPPADAYERGLRHRFAVVLDTARRDKMDMYFDTELFMRLVPILCQTIGYDRLDIRMTDGRRFTSFDELAGHFSSQVEFDQEPPFRIELYRSG